MGGVAARGTSPLLSFCLAIVMRHIVIGTAGHIDHGKSALVRSLTGTDPDRLQEEKARGITIDLGFALLADDDIQLSFVDVPGHERFVKNMLAGASGIDGVLLVIAADESVMPQTREHFDICRLLGVSSGVVALTKADLVDADTVELVKLETAELVAGSFLEEAPMIPVSSKTGVGLSEIREALLAMARGTVGRTGGGSTRLPIDRAFTVKGFGTVVTGTLVSGRMTVEDSLSVMPAGRDVKVRGLQVHGLDQSEAVAGQRVAANLAGVGVAEIMRGDTAVMPCGLDATQRIDAVLDLLPSVRGLRHGARVRFHQGTSEVLGRVSIGPTVRGFEMTEDAPAALPPGGRAFVRLRLEGPAVLTRGDRFILRAYSPPLTIAGGVVLDPEPARGGIRTAAARVRLERLFCGGELESLGGLDQAIGVMVAERGLSGFTTMALVVRAGVAPEETEEVCTRVLASGVAHRVGDLLVDATIFAESRERLIAMVKEFHDSAPLSDGLPREEARERLCGQAGPGVFDAILDTLVSEGTLVARDHLALTSHRVTLSPEENDVSDAVLTKLREAGLRPSAPAALCEELKTDGALLDRVVRLLVRQKQLVRVGALVFDVGAMERLKNDLRALRSTDGTTEIDVGMFKDRYGVSRKFAIPLLEYMDRERVTRRLGQKRILL